jgi:hypothetical protein
MPADFPRIDWWDFAFGVKAVERAGGRPEAGKRRFLAGFGGYFQSSGTELSLS